MAEDDAALDPPKGFVRLTRCSPFTEYNGPVFCLTGQETSVHGFRALPRHGNIHGIVHGGMLASFLDTVLGQAAADAGRQRVVTVHLSVDYLSMARVGDWIEGRATVTRLTRDLVFAEARAHVFERDVVRAAGVFKRMGEKPA